jgi:hypothetical protein
MKTLGELVSAALASAGEHAKTASLYEAPQEDQVFRRVDDFLAVELGQVERVQEVKTASAAPAPSTGSNLDDCAYALKLAESLELGADILQKLASEPAILEAPFHSATTQAPKPQASASAKAQTAPKTPGPTGKLPDDNGTGKVAADRGATERLLKAKIAQHSALVSLGQVDAATQVFEEARELKAKLAAGELPTYANGEGPGGGRIPDNQGLISMTKAQARDANTREAVQFYGEPVKKDNAVAAHNITTHGLKVSSKTLVKSASVGMALQRIGTKVVRGVRGAGNSLAGAGERMAGSGNGVMKSIGKGLGGAGEAMSGLQASGTARRVIGGTAVGAGVLGTGLVAKKVFGSKDKER